MIVYNIGLNVSSICWLDTIIVCVLRPYSVTCFGCLKCNHKCCYVCTVQVPVERHGHLVIGYQDLQKSEPLYPTATSFITVFLADMRSQDIGPLLLK